MGMAVSLVRALCMATGIARARGLWLRMYELVLFTRTNKQIQLNLHVNDFFLSVFFHIHHSKRSFWTMSSLETTLGIWERVHSTTFSTSSFMTSLVPLERNQRSVLGLIDRSDRSPHCFLLSTLVTGLTSRSAEQEVLTDVKSCPCISWFHAFLFILMDFLRAGSFWHYIVSYTNDIPFVCLKSYYSYQAPSMWFLGDFAWEDGKPSSLRFVWATVQQYAIIFVLKLKKGMHLGLMIHTTWTQYRPCKPHVQ